MRRIQQLSGWSASLAGDHSRSSEERREQNVASSSSSSSVLQDIDLLQTASGGILNKPVLYLPANMLHMSRPITKLSNYEGTCYYIKSAWVQREGEERGHISLKNIMGMWSKGRFLIYTMSSLYLPRFSREQPGDLERTDIFLTLRAI